MVFGLRRRKNLSASIQGYTARGDLQSSDHGVQSGRIEKDSVDVMDGARKIEGGPIADSNVAVQRNRRGAPIDQVVSRIGDHVTVAGRPNHAALDIGRLDD